MKTVQILTVLVSGLLAGCWIKAPLHPEAQRLNGLGAQALAEGRLVAAEDSLRLSLEYNPCHAQALHNLAAVAYLQGDLVRAESLEHAALACEPLVQAFNGLGAIAFKRGLWEEAEQQFSRAVEMDPGYLDARRNLVLCLLLMKEHDEAALQLGRLKVLSPDDPLFLTLSGIFGDKPQGEGML